MAKIISYPSNRFCDTVLHRNHNAPKQEAYSTRDIETQKVLAQISRSTVFGFAIGEAMDRIHEPGGSGVFRKLMKMLRDQKRDCPAALKRIIGAEAFNAIDLA